MKKRSLHVTVALLLMCTAFHGLLSTTPGAEAAAVNPAKWQKYAGNPVFPNGANGSWESSDITLGCIMLDNGTYKLYYSAYSGLEFNTTSRIGYAYSDDGLCWTRYAGNPILNCGPNGSWDCRDLAHPWVIRDGSMYKMWYSGSGPNAVGKIGLATSPDGINWTRNGSAPVFVNGSSGAWDGYIVSDPCIIKECGEYRMWYLGLNNNCWQVGFANSTDGINWTRYASNPVLKVGDDWDRGSIRSVCVLNDSGTYRLWYDSSYEIGYATSNDGLCWTKYAGNPVLEDGDVGEFDHASVRDPLVLKNASGYRMWYLGINSTSGGVYKVGCADGLNTPPEPPSLYMPHGAEWINDTRPELAWTFEDVDPGDSQTAFQVQIDNDSDFGSVYLDTGKTISTKLSHTPASALPDGKSYWRARAWDDDYECSEWSSGYSMQIDTTPPGNPTRFWSESHNVGVWSTDKTIQVSFDGETDAGSGVIGYSFLWDYQCDTLPDSVLDKKWISQNTSKSMSDSNSIYFHIRAIDNVYNIAPDAAHYGPFFVDNTPPTNPTINCSTHNLSTWTNLTVCNVSWSGAADSTSGVNGYSVEWSMYSGTLPDMVKDLNATNASASSPGLADGTWYFHVRTVDNATNWATTAAHFGPIWVDATPPKNPLVIDSDHLPATWSNIDTVGVMWSGHNGSLSGVEAFSYLWDCRSGTVPDEVPECTEAVTWTTSPLLEDGSMHFFHIRTKDRAGNWNATATQKGPFWIDTTPPANPVQLRSTSHSTDRWSNDTTIDVAWSLPEGGDPLSGYRGFSIVWDTSGTTVPDEKTELAAEVSTATSPPRFDGSSIWFHIRALDRAGNWAPGAAHLGPFSVDSTPPKNPTVLLSPSHLTGHWTADNTVTMDWWGADGRMSGTDGYSAVWDNFPDTMPPARAVLGPVAQTTASPPLQDGTNWYFHLRVKDAAGNWAATAVHRGPFWIDTTPPQVQALTINRGARLTSDPRIVLALKASDASPGAGLGEMRYSVDDQLWSAWGPYSENWNFSLAGADGLRTVHVQVRDRVGNPGVPFNASILLDTSAPSGAGIWINGGAGITNSTSVALSIHARDPEPGSGISDMSLSGDNRTWGDWEPFETTRDFELPPGDGIKVVHMKLRDRAGNTATAASNGILLDTTPPSNLSIRMERGDSIASFLTVQLELEAADPQPGSGVEEMAFSEDRTAWTDWEPFARLATYTFGPGDGKRMLYFTVRDRVQNRAPTAGAAITLDTTPPIVETVSLVTAGPGNLTITVMLSEPGTVRLDYGPGTTIGNSLTSPVMERAHEVLVQGLDGSTGYHFHISSTDQFGNGPGTIVERTFRTEGAPAEAPRGGLLGLLPAPLLLFALVGLVGVVAGCALVARKKRAQKGR